MVACATLVDLILLLLCYFLIIFGLILAHFRDGVRLFMVLLLLDLHTFLEFSFEFVVRPFLIFMCESEQ
jgi:hypothetical protein